MELIGLHSITKDNSVLSSVPNYFNNSETPVICYKYNILSTIYDILSTIDNFDNIVTSMNIVLNTPDS